MLSVLFVCTGNICRSPLAEALLESRARDMGLPIEASSVGTSAWRDNPAEPETVQAARELGIDLRGHRARALEAGPARAADLVLGLTSRHADRVVELAPDAAPKTFTLKEVAALLGALPPAGGTPDERTAEARIADAHHLRASGDGPAIGDLDVVDPIGMPIDTFRAVLWDIGAAVDGLVAGLFGDLRARAASAEG